MEGVKEVSEVDFDSILDGYERGGRGLEVYEKAARQALLSDLAYRTSRNDTTHRVDYADDEQRYRFESGLITPAEGLALLHDQPNLGSIELARHMHVGDAIGPAAVSMYLRDSLNEGDAVQSQTVDVSDKSPSYYRITGFNVADPRLQEVITVTRKKELLTHFDDQLVTILADTYLLDLESKSIDDATRRAVFREFERLDELRANDAKEAERWTGRHHNFIGPSVAPIDVARQGLADAVHKKSHHQLSTNGVLPLSSVVYASTRKARSNYQHRLVD